ncbi:MAG: hydantoinase/oxoprolinase family protein [Actinobacteria bacterium]|nr:hydantoinase/oxoprolinase family protein [Actinomycetota bacterium]
MSRPDRQHYVVGIDIGGTCTDCVVVDAAGSVTLAKAFSTPPDFQHGIVDALGVAATELGISTAELLAATRLFLHSTTVAENAVVDGTLATAGVITTAGFEDTLFAMRGGYGRWSGLTEDEKRNPIETEKPEPIVPRSLVRGIAERADATGNVHRAPAEAELEEAVRQLVEAGVEAVGVSFLWSFVNPAAEELAARVARRVAPGVFLTLSHKIAPVVGEYERTSTVALNARLGPVVRRYLDDLRAQLTGLGFDGILLVAQAHGGLLPVDEAAERPVGMIESGPVSGLVGSRALGELIGSKDIIAADIGGTTFKVGVVRDGRLDYQRESMVLRHHYALPKMDVVSLGLAGGSIVSVDPRSGVPRLGPRSAGSYPGPVCYGHGGNEPTVTDVDAILGYLNADFFLGGRAGLDVDASRRAFEEQVARPLGLEVEEAAPRIYRFANERFFDLLHKVTVQRGLDPRRFALFSFGGTAGMHAAAYGEELGVARIVIPHSASVHGAFGLVTSDVVHEQQTTQPLRAPVDTTTLAELFDGLRAKVVAQLEAEGFGSDRIALTRSIDMRYRRQVHILTVQMPEGDGPITADLVARTVELFEEQYRERYGPESAYREAGIELVSYRLRGAGIVERPDFRSEETATTDASGAVVRTVRAWVDRAGAWQDVSGYDFERLVPGNEVPGPAVVWTPITTLVVPPSRTARIDAFRNVVINLGTSAAGANNPP